MYSTCVKFDCDPLKLNIHKRLKIQCKAIHILHQPEYLPIKRLWDWRDWAGHRTINSIQTIVPHLLSRYAGFSCQTSIYTINFYNQYFIESVLFITTIYEPTNLIQYYIGKGVKISMCNHLTERGSWGPKLTHTFPQNDLLLPTAFVSFYSMLWLNYHTF